MQRISQDTMSLEQPLGDEDDFSLSDLIEDQGAEVPRRRGDPGALNEAVHARSRALERPEQEIVRLRFGLDDGRIRTLEEVGQIFGVTRERVRQIEMKTLAKLRQPSISQAFSSWRAQNAHPRSRLEGDQQCSRLEIASSSEDHCTTSPASSWTSQALASRIAVIIPCGTLEPTATRPWFGINMAFRPPIERAISSPSSRLRIKSPVRSNRAMSGGTKRQPSCEIGRSGTAFAANAVAWRAWVWMTQATSGRARMISVWIGYSL
jgi:hypothetical protein